MNSNAKHFTEIPVVDIAGLFSNDPTARLAVAEELGRASLAQRLAELQRECGDAQQAELWSRLSLRLEPRQPLL